MGKVDFFDTPAPPDRGYFRGASRDEPKTAMSKKSQKMISKMEAGSSFIDLVIYLPRVFLEMDLK